MLDAVRWSNGLDINELSQANQKVQEMVADMKRRGLVQRQGRALRITDEGRTRWREEMDRKLQLR